MSGLGPMERLRVNAALAPAGAGFVVRADDLRAILEGINCARLAVGRAEALRHEAMAARRHARRLLWAALAVALFQLGVLLWLG